MPGTTGHSINGVPPVCPSSSSGAQGLPHPSAPRLTRTALPRGPEERLVLLALVLALALLVLLLWVLLLVPGVVLLVLALLVLLLWVPG